MLETASSTGPVNQEASKERKLSSFCLFEILDPDFLGTVENKTVLSMYLAEEIGSDVCKRGTLNLPNVQAWGCQVPLDLIAGCTRIVHSLCALFVPKAHLLMYLCSSSASLADPLAPYMQMFASYLSALSTSMAPEDDFGLRWTPLSNSAEASLDHRLTV